jgi:DNA-directed RNA polymerase specialized sigma24 family protein
MLRHVEGMSISEIGSELGLENQRDQTLHLPRAFARCAAALAPVPF